MRETKDALAGLPIDFVGVSVDGRWTDKETLGIGLVLNDPGSQVTSRLRIDRVPYTVVVNPQGVVTWAEYGIVRSQELTAAARSSAFHSIENEPKIAYLTFDDFPSPKLAFELLDELRALKAPATFFCVCSHLASEPDLAHQMERQGDLVEIHSWDHNHDHPQLERCVQAVEAFGLPRPKLYRPPGSEAVLKLDGTPVKESVIDPYDYLRPSSEEIARRVLLRVRSGSVIQLHAGVQETLDALPEIVRNLRTRGFTLRLLSDRAD